MRDFFSIQLEITNEFKSKLVQWADRFTCFSYLDSNQARDQYTHYDFILAVDALSWYHNLDELTDGKFYFGHLGYNFNSSQNAEKPFIDFGDCLFFEPRYILYGKNGRLHINRNSMESLEILSSIQAEIPMDYNIPKFNFKSRTEKNEYIQNIDRIQDSIRKGQFYELNYCVEFYNENASINAAATFHKINQVAKSPMSALIKYEDRYALCFSPERLAQLSGCQLISQPIKGTARRNLIDSTLDCQIKQDLETSIKERAENIMIVDLVRNDMTPYAKTGSIQVDELCKVYTFPFVHQMISTVSAELKDKKQAKHALRNLLPAGSMTGAPKMEVMHNIQEIENFTRGLYAGNIGYFEPNGNFDFNVVIRTLYYDAKHQNISLAVGGAITLLSDAKREYNECLLKAEGILRFFHDSSYI